MSVPSEIMAPEFVREPLSEDEVRNAVDAEIQAAQHQWHKEIGSNMESAWHYFRGTAPAKLDEDVDEYFDSVVSRDVADAIESTMAEILPAFANDRPVEFNPLGPGDEDAVALESDICNEILMEAGNGYYELSTAVKNLLMLRIGALEIQWDDSDVVEIQDLENVPPEYIAQLAQDPNTEIIERITTTEISTDVPQINTTMDIRVKTTRKKNKISVEAVPMDELMISSDATSCDLDKVRFVGRQTLVSRSQLILDGYDPDVVETLQAWTQTTSHRVKYARERNFWQRDKRVGHRGMDQILVSRCYYRLDEDGDGIAELREIIVAGDRGGLVILSDEPVTYQPFAAGVAYIWPHSAHGVSLYDKLRSIQELKTRFWRLMLEGGTRAARDRIGVMPGTNLNQLNTSQFGGYIEITSPNGVVPIPSPTFPSQLMELQAFADKARKEGGGGAIDKAAREAMPVEAGAHGVERYMTALEELNSMVARNISETIVRQAYLKIHHLLRRFSPPIARKNNDQWVNINPRQWPQREQVGVKVGLTLADRNRQAAAMESIINRQMKLMELGAIISNPKKLYEALVSQSRMLGIQNAQSYFVDPESPEGIQAKERKIQEQQQASQTQQQAVQQQQSLMFQLEQLRGQMRIQQEAMKQQAGMIKDRNDMMESSSKLREDQRQFNQNLQKEYDELRLKLAELEAKYGPVEIPNA